MREDGFKTYMASLGLAHGTFTTRSAALRRIERAENIDLDAEYERDGLNGLLAKYAYSTADHRAGLPNPTAIDIEPENLRKYIAFYRRALNNYHGFVSGGLSDDFEAGVTEAEAEANDAVAETASKSFALERDLQNAIRTDIGQLEPGLEIVDGGREARVEAGLIDVLAKDIHGVWTIIELKAEVARPSVIAQTLAYMASIAEERGGAVRGIIVAADFDQRVELAARAVPNLQLKRYRYRFEFE